MTRRKTSKALFYLALGMITLNVVISLKLYLNSRTFIKQQIEGMPLAPFDVAVVFYSGAVDQQNRLWAGHEALREGRAKHMLIVGGARPDRNFSGAKAWQDALITQSSVHNAISIDKGSYDTCSNIAAMLGEMKSQNWDTALLFSDPLHSLRINYMLAENNRPQPRMFFDNVAYDGGFLAPMHRTQHEILAYVSLSIPKGIRRKIVGNARANTSERGTLYDATWPNIC